MRKILLMAVLIVSAVTASFAQTSKSSSSTSGKFSIGVDPGVPVGSVSDVSSFAIGGDIKYSLPAAPNFDVSLSAGYTVFIGKTIDFGGTSVKVGNLKAIPVKLGGRYNFSGATGFFGEVGIGAAFIQDGGGTAFVYAPGIGYALDGGFEVGARYEGWSKNGSIGQIGFRVAYSFQ
ncbi:outer membrane beta-barrel protein [Mucilaginibacter sp. BT774]|uniref:outer membrane beta-barrel protein n=1 Tax=Mucilaginibacter sp. BT774 TaxID=3062276 RepID=UPI00267530ED|nr:outer membrane beta-barrel protein [Mucilaginibacter sp. BT774]MDO3625873.1 outer membrane beta-barrel protein [Mucilaginibacter sp. BT774]